MSSCPPLDWQPQSQLLESMRLQPHRQMAYELFRHDDPLMESPLIRRLIERRMIQGEEKAKMKLVTKYMVLVEECIATMEYVIVSTTTHTRDMFLLLDRYLAMRYIPTINRDEHWWRRGQNYNSVPCEEAMDTSVESYLFNDRHQFLRVYSHGLPSQNFGGLLTIVLQKVWPQKTLHVNQFIRKLHRSIEATEKRRLFSEGKARKAMSSLPIGLQLARHLIQWWCLFMMGGYGFCNTWQINMPERNRWVKIWCSINTQSKAELLFFINQELFSKPVILALAIQTFVVYYVRRDFVLRDWLMEKCGKEWSDWEQETIALGDRYRVSDGETDTGIVKDINLHMEQSDTLSHRSRFVTDYLGYIASLTSEPSFTTLTHNHQRFSVNHIHRMATYSLNNLHLIPGGVDECSRITTWIHCIMTYFHCPPISIDYMTHLAAVFYKEDVKVGKSDIHEIHLRLEQEFPYAYQIWSVLMSARRLWNTVYSIPLPLDTVHLQLKRYKELFKNGNLPPRLDWLLYCTNCKRIRALVDQSKTKGSLYPTHYIASQVAGFSNVLVDVKSTMGNELKRPLYCGRKVGQQVAVCVETELKHISMTGQLIYCYDQLYTICAQPGCGGKMQVNIREDVYNQYGWQCSTCANIEYMIENKGISAYAPVPNLNHPISHHTQKKRGRPPGTKNKATTAKAKPKKEVVMEDVLEESDDDDDPYVILPPSPKRTKRQLKNEANGYVSDVEF